METRQITTVRGVGGPFHARLTGVGASLFKPMAEQAGQSGGFALTGWIRPAAGCALPAEVARIEDKRGDACTIEAGADGLALVVPDGVPHLVTDGDAGGWMWCALLADERGAAARRGAGAVLLRRQPRQPSAGRDGRHYDRGPEPRRGRREPERLESGAAIAAAGPPGERQCVNPICRHDGCRLPT